MMNSDIMYKSVNFIAFCKCQFCLERYNFTFIVIKKSINNVSEQTYQ